MRVIEIVYKDGTKEQFEGAEFYRVGDNFIRVGRYARVKTKQIKKVGFFWWLKREYVDVTVVDEDEEIDKRHINIDCILKAHVIEVPK